MDVISAQVLLAVKVVINSARISDKWSLLVL